MLAERWPSGTQPIASKPEPVVAKIERQWAASPGFSRPTRGIEFLNGVIVGYRFFAGACRSYAVRPVEIVTFLASESFIKPSVSWVVSAMFMRSVLWRGLGVSRISAWMNWRSRFARDRWGFCGNP